MSLYTRIIRPCLFRLDPETAHTLSIEACRVASRIAPVRAAFRHHFEVTDPVLETEIGGLRIRNPLGLAAGWDKSGHAARMLGSLGFGFAEIGSVSHQLSHGNPRPRLFRLPEDQAIIVYYGLPNDGAPAVARRLRAAGPCGVPLGVNIVKTNFGPGAPPATEEETLLDYTQSVHELAGCCDYLVLNLSCPNATGGKDYFAEPGHIGRLLRRLPPDLRPPMFLKVIPTTDPAFLEALVAEAVPHRFVRGFIFNLAPGKPPWLRLRTPRAVWEKLPGAVSGAPVAAMLNTCIRELFTRMPRDRFEIIGVGGVFSAADAYEKIRLGASAVQLYTAMVYHGPGIVREINLGLRELLQRDGFHNVREAVGSAY